MKWYINSPELSLNYTNYPPNFQKYYWINIWFLFDINYKMLQYYLLSSLIKQTRWLTTSHFTYCYLRRGLPLHLHETVTVFSNPTLILIASHFKTVISDLYKKVLWSTKLESFWKLSSDSKLYHSALDPLTDKGIWIPSKDSGHMACVSSLHFCFYSSPFWDNTSIHHAPIYINRRFDSVQCVVYRLAYSSQEINIIYKILLL